MLWNALVVASLSLSSTTGLERLSLTDPHAAAREALEGGDAARARELLGEQAGRAPALVTAPGLYGRALEAAGERERACAVYEADLRDRPERAEAAQLRVARCRSWRVEQLPGDAPSRQAAIEDAAGAWRSVMLGPVLGQDVLVLDEARAALEALGAAKEAAATLTTAAILDLPAPTDTLRREALARLYLLLAREGRPEDRPRALERLYLHLGETPAAVLALKQKEAKELASHKDLARALERAQVLTDRHDNQGVFDTLQRHLPKPTAVDEASCQVRLLWGRAARKLRRYQTSRQALDVAAERCSGDVQRRARYLAAQVAYYQSASQGLPLLEAFAKAYPDDSLTDDVLFWRAELLEREGKIEQAIAGYREIAERFPDGDMREDARFNLAFLLARHKDPAGARAVLDEVARTATDAPTLVRDRALYWRARLLLYPDPMTLTPTADKAARQSGFEDLVAFASARPASYYGHLARLLALNAAEAVGASREELVKTLQGAAASPREAFTGQGTLPTGALARDPRFTLAVQLASAGYDDEAERLLDVIEYRKLDDTARLALVLLYTQIGARGKAHQVMRFTGHALPSGKPTGPSLLTWHLAFPRAYDDAIDAATRAVERVPKALLMGLAREESAFDADVVSWAGAIGLCQLMPFTAKEEAQLLKLGDPSLAELRQPALNARLGANHLSRRMKLLSHPLLAIAAYNAGPGNVAKWRKANAPKPIDAWVESIPVEQTRLYVKKVTGSWVVYEALDGDVSRVSFPLVLP